MSEKNKIPEIRFNGFGGEWIVKKFKTLTKINQGLQIAISNRYTEKIDGSYFYITNEFLKESSDIKYYILNPPETVLCTEDDVLMTRTGNTGEVVTNIAGAFHNNFFKIKFDSKELNKNFFVYFLRLFKTQSIILRLAGTSTIPDLNHSDFYRIEMPFPSLTEQTKIGNYLLQLDTLITLHQKKYEKLLNVKKAMLEKMFPKNGADVPEIRFKGFSEKWEERELGEIADRYDNLRVPITATSRVSGSTPYYGANGIQGYVEGYTHDGEFILVAEDGANDLKNYPIRYVNGKIWVNNHAHVLQSKKNITVNHFLKFAISQTNIEPFLVGGGRAKLNAETMMKIVINIPLNIEEQTKIGNFFKNLDTLLTLHQNELEKLKNIKKACLKKMFV